MEAKGGPADFRGLVCGTNKRPVNPRHTGSAKPSKPEAQAKDSAAVLGEVATFACASGLNAPACPGGAMSRS